MAASPRIADPSCSGLSKHPETVPCGKNSAAPVRARTRADARQRRGAVPGYRKTAAAFRDVSVAERAGKRRLAAGEASATDRPRSGSTTLYLLLVSRPSTTGPGRPVEVGGGGARSYR